MSIDIGNTTESDTARLASLVDMAAETRQPRYRPPAPMAIARHDKCLYLRIKRLMDVVLSCILLILLSPLLLLIAVLIKLHSPGPVIFSQERMGYDSHSRKQRTFVFHKFRSMYHNCDQSVHQEHVKDWIRGKKGAKSSSNHAERVKLTKDQRVTRVGRILRYTSLDELPQLWDVLKGDMSLVGPRPVPLYEVAEYEEWHRQRLEATPGITGLWQVKARGRVTLDEMASLDIEYINRQSLCLDLKILLVTPPAVISGRGAA